MQQEYPGKLSYISCLVLEEYVILVKCFLNFENRIIGGIKCRVFFDRILILPFGVDFL